MQILQFLTCLSCWTRRTKIRSNNGKNSRKVSLSPTNFACKRIYCWDNKPILLLLLYIFIKVLNASDCMCLTQDGREGGGIVERWTCSRGQWGHWGQGGGLQPRESRHAQGHRDGDICPGLPVSGELEGLPKFKNINTSERFFLNCYSGQRNQQLLCLENLDNVTSDQTEAGGACDQWEGHSQASSITVGLGCILNLLNCSRGLFFLAGGTEALNPEDNETKHLKYFTFLDCWWFSILDFGFRTAL